MKTTVNNIASENSTFVVNQDMLNEKKALKYISKPNMLAAIKEICEAIKSMNSKFTPKEYTEADGKKELFDAYGRFYTVYSELKKVEEEARHRAEEKAEREERARQKEIEKNTKELIKPAEPVKTEEQIKAEQGKKASKEKKEKAAKEPKRSRTADAQERLDKYTAELKEKEAIENPTHEVKHRIASLKRKIERANKALGVN
jgi:hypothetical protein